MESTEDEGFHWNVKKRKQMKQMDALNSES